MTRGTQTVTTDPFDGTAHDTVRGLSVAGSSPELVGDAATHINVAQMRAWRAFLVAHAGIVRRLEDDLMAERQLPLAMYDVLVQLAEAPQRRLRMTELAEAVLLSRSGLTRLVDRMVRQGHVHREPSPLDARGVYAVLTEAGLQCLREAAPTHLRGISDYLLVHLDDAELDAFGSACTKVVAGLTAAAPDEDPDDAADDVLPAPREA